MEYLFWSLLLWIFLYLNACIIYTDIKIKKIPNIYLIRILLLLPFCYTYALIFWLFGDIQIWVFILQISLSFLLSFLLFHFNIWWAGDAKYLLILSLYIPHIGILPFIFYIALIVILYLLFYFIWFWLGPNLWIKTKRKDLFWNLWKSKKDKFTIENSNRNKRQILNDWMGYILGFLLLFICIRLLRIHLIEYFIDRFNITPFQILEYILYSWIWIYILVGIILIWITIGFCIKKIYTYAKSLFQGKGNNILLILWNFILLWIIFLEYLHNSEAFFSNMLLILTVYLGVFFLIRILFFAYKMVFLYQEESLVHINNVQEGMKIDKKTIIKDLTWNGYIEENKIDINSVSNMSVVNIQDLLKNIDVYQTSRKTKNYSPYTLIKVFKTSAFWIYIFLWFLLSSLIFLL